MRKTSTPGYRLWGPGETQALIELVEEIGVGKWRQILDKGGERFHKRTPVDLKDKWRNLKGKLPVGVMISAAPPAAPPPAGDGSAAPQPAPAAKPRPGRKAKASKGGAGGSAAAPETAKQGRKRKAEQSGAAEAPEAEANELEGAPAADAAVDITGGAVEPATAREDASYEVREEPVPAPAAEAPPPSKRTRGGGQPKNTAKAPAARAKQPAKGAKVSGEPPAAGLTRGRAHKRAVQEAAKAEPGPAGKAEPTPDGAGATGPDPPARKKPKRRTAPKSTGMAPAEPPAAAKPGSLAAAVAADKLQAAARPAKGVVEPAAEPAKPRRGGRARKAAAAHMASPMAGEELTLAVGSGILGEAEAGLPPGTAEGAAAATPAVPQAAGAALVNVEDAEGVGDGLADITTTPGLLAAATAPLTSSPEQRRTSRLFDRVLDVGRRLSDGLFGAKKAGER